MHVEIGVQHSARPYERMTGIYDFFMFNARQGHALVFDMRCFKGQRLVVLVQYSVRKLIAHFTQRMKIRINSIARHGQQTSEIDF